MSYDAADDQLHRANRALQLVLACCKAVARAEDEAEMLHEVCSIVTNNHYPLAWIGFPLDSPGKPIEIAASAGRANEYAQLVRLTWDEENPRGNGPAGRAVRSRQPMTVKHIASNPAFCTQQEAGYYGLQSVVALPLLHDDTLVGLMGVYSDIPDAFDDDEVSLLMELADEIAFGIVSLRARRANQAAQDMRVEAEVLRAQLAQQAELTELKSRFITIASHEFRTPLTTILSSSDLLKMYAERMNQERRDEHLDRIQDSVRHMISLLEDFLMMEQLEVGQALFEPTPINVRAVCVTIVQEQLLNGALPRRIEFHYGGDCDRAVMDMRLLREILKNLLSNALKYSPEDRPVHLNVHCDGGWVTFEVIDEGIGIPEDEQVRLFDLFYRANNVGTIPGTGLGLSIAKAAVHLHGGTITFESRIGQGTRFTVRLPLVPQHS